MAASDRRLGQLEKRLAHLERRLAAEPRQATRPGRPAGRSSRTDLEILDRLRESAAPGRGRGGKAGTVVYAGAVRIGEEEYLHAREHEVPALLGGDHARAARLLVCLGSPVRLALATAMLGAPRTTQELQEVLGEGTTGQLYHHLRDLQAAGLLTQPRRGVYRLAAHAAVPVLTMLAAAPDLGSGEPLEQEA